MASQTRRRRIDKDELYGTYLETHRKDAKFKDDVRRKALDLPVGEDDTNITTKTINNYNGLNLGKLISFGLTAAATGGIGLGTVAYALGWLQPPTKPDQPATTPTAKTKEYKVEFFDANGRKIEVKENQ